MSLSNNTTDGLVVLGSYSWSLIPRIFSVVDVTTQLVAVKYSIPITACSPNDAIVVFNILRVKIVHPDPYSTFRLALNSLLISKLVFGTY